MPALAQSPRVPVPNVRLLDAAHQQLDDAS